MDLSPFPQACHKPPDLPIEVDSGVGGFVNNTIVVCGTVYNPEGTGACYTYDKDNDQWVESYEVLQYGENGMAVSVSKNRMMVMGGYYDYSVHDTVQVG